MARTRAKGSATSGEHGRRERKAPLQFPEQGLWREQVVVGAQLPVHLPLALHRIARLSAHYVANRFGDVVRQRTAATVFPLSDPQDARLAALVLRSNPALPAHQARAFARLMPKSTSSRTAPIRSALIIRDPYVTMILDGKKTWEIRGRSTKIRDRIALIKGGSGTVVGTCELVDVVGPLTLAQYRKNAHEAGHAPSEIHRLDYPQTFAWVMNAPVRLRRPVAYDHPSGAVIWVTLSPDVVRKLRN